MPFQSSTVLLADPSCVVVCTAELCCCQEEGFGGDEILEHLRAQNLPYPTEEAPCLGACGGGAKISIDFEDGSYALLTGMEETLSELGLTNSDTRVNEPSEEYGNGDLKDSIEAYDTIIETPVDNELAIQTVKNHDKELPDINKIETLMDDRQSKEEPLGDVRDRMRQAYTEEQQTNPWLNAASYLVKKAGEKMFTKD